MAKNEQSGKPEWQHSEERKEEKAGAAEGTEPHKVLQGSKILPKSLQKLQKNKFHMPDIAIVAMSYTD